MTTSINNWEKTDSAKMRVSHSDMIQSHFGEESSVTSHQGSWVVGWGSDARQSWIGKVSQPD